MKTCRRKLRHAIVALVIGIAGPILSLPALARPGKSTPPSTPGNFHVTTLTSGGVTFAWNASIPGSGGGLLYDVYNDTTGLILNVGNVTSYTWAVGIQPGGTYSFHIIAVSGTPPQASSPSPEVTVTIPGAPPIPPAVQPDPPVITQTSVTLSTITVSWTEVTPVDEIGAYAISVNGIEVASSPANATTVTATGLTPGYTYIVTVTAYSLNGTTGALSTKSLPVTVMTATATTTPPPTTPTTPTGLTGAGDGGGEAIISWNPSTSVNEPQSQIQYNIYIDGVLDSFDSTVGQTSDVYIFPRGADVPAQVWIVAVDQFGNQSAPSNVLTISGF